MIFLNIIGSGPSEEKIKEKIIESLQEDPDTSDVVALKNIISDIEAETLIK